MTTEGPPAHWAADPSGRHQHRYWDGSEWTDHVADAGVAALDPLVPTAPTLPAEVVTPAATDTATAWPPVAPADERPPTPTLDTIEPPSAVVRPLPPPPLGNVPGAPEFRSSLAAVAPTLRTWRSLDGVRNALVATLGLAGVAAVAVIATLINRISALDDYERFGFSFSRVDAIDDSRSAVVAAVVVFLVIVAIAAVLFVIWQWRVAENALVLARLHPRFEPGWAIGAWFIPAANCVLPILMLQDLWRASSPTTSPGTDWRDRRGSALLGWWWAVLLIGSFTGVVGALNDSPGLTEMQSNADAGILGFVALLVA
ncbi:MAG: DUF4328 domain-containing protein, partial [Acidimicrobiia bacterium]